MKRASALLRCCSRGLAMALLLGASTQATAATDPMQLMRSVESRPEPRQVRAELRFELTDEGGRTQNRSAVAYRLREDGSNRQAIYLTQPRHLSGTALLTWMDPSGARADDQWLYLPTLKRSRRVPAADKRQPFLGSDLSLGDMRALAKVNTREYRFDSATPVPGAANQWWITGEPVDAQTARGLGYGASRWRIDPVRQVVLEAEHRDPEGQPLKHVMFEAFEQVDAARTPHRVLVSNLQTGTRTALHFERVDTQAAIEPSALTESGLPRGP